jgi:hypothetical protein
MNTNIPAKDLTKEAPRSAYETMGGYAILPRAIDKGRATIAGTNGEYNFNCPVDNKFLSFTGLKGEDMKKALADGATDEEVLDWVNKNAPPHTEEEIKAWSDSFRSDNSYSTNPEKSGWFISECKKYGLDPSTTTLFDYLDVDDRESHK